MTQTRPLRANESMTSKNACAMLGQDLLLRVHLLHLIDDQSEPRVLLARLRFLAGQRIADERSRGLR